MQASELRNKSVEELSQEWLDLRREQFTLRMQIATGELTQNHQHRRVKKDIARVKTILNELQRAAGDSQ